MRGAKIGYRGKDKIQAIVKERHTVLSSHVIIEVSHGYNTRRVLLNEDHLDKLIDDLKQAKKAIKKYEKSLD